MLPANAEIVIEGYVDPAERLRLEGPFGDHTGYYSLADMYPVLHVTAITHCKNPVYPTTVVGRPVQEDCYLGWATERIFLPLIKMLFPEVIDYHLPFWGIFHNVMFIKIKKYYPFQAQRLMQGVWGTGQMTFTKMIFVFDEDIDLTELHSVIKAILKNCDFEKHVTFSEGALDVLDHSAPQPIYGSKIGFDCTTKLIEEFPLAKERVHPQFHIIPVDKKNAFDGRKAITEAIQKEGHPFVIAVDKNININDHFEVLFRLGNNVDPKRDSVQLNHCIGFDATTKLASEGFTREWPKDIEMNHETKKLVDQKWSSYGIS
jgi:4-hydroxy-3-polyprenylbenzoate decarboxylase